MSNISVFHELEQVLRKSLEEKDADNPVLKKIYCSTFWACQSYSVALRELLRKGGDRQWK